MGVNVAGVPDVRMCGTKGKTAKLRFAEVLYPNLPQFAGNIGRLMVENLRDADCTDLYTFRGDPDGEKYCPRFTFRGYRYIEISGVAKEPQRSDVRMKVLSSVPELTGKVEVSEQLINQFLENVRRSQQSNFISIPTDCPQRNERMGWDGDTAIFARTATFNSDTRLFYSRWLQCMRDLQDENGKYPDIAPVGGGFGGYTYESAAIMVAYELYQQYGDIKVISDNFDAMNSFMDYSARLYSMDNLDDGFTLGDWLAPEETSIKFICEAFYGNNARCMAKMASAVGNLELAQSYNAMYENMRRKFSKKWFDPVTGRTKDDTQCSYSLPISMCMLDNGLIDKAGDCLAEKTRRMGYLIGSGFFGTTPISTSLTRTGHAEDAYRLMEQTKCPSWLYPVTQGATSIWERWDSYTKENGFGGHNNMNSFNHYSLGAVFEWFYTDVLGIRRDEDKPGYKHFIVNPAIGNWKFARGGFETPYGRIEVSWEHAPKCEYSEITGNKTNDVMKQIPEVESDNVIISVKVPANTTATIMLEDGRRSDVGSGRYSYRVAKRRNKFDNAI